MKTIIVLGAIVEKDGKVLLAKRKKGISMAGKWEFPGGKLEDGETEKECLKREIKEELGVDAEVGNFFAENNWPGKDKIINLKCYKTSLITERMTLTDHDEIAWVKPGELLSYDLAPADVSVAWKLQGK